MREITLRAYAKINLSLDVIGKRSDGYHDLETVMQQINLYDDVSVRLYEKEEGENLLRDDRAHEQAIQDDRDQEDAGQKKVQAAAEGIVLTSTDPAIPNDRGNLAYRAANMMRMKYRPDDKQVIAIHLSKRIPVSAGLAGGSADAAAVIHALKILWKLPVSFEDLVENAASLGADVPFCLMGQAAVMQDAAGERLYSNASTCALAEGIGEKLTPVPPLDSLVLLTKPPIGVSTAEVFQKLDIGVIAERPETRELVAGLREKNLFKIGRNMVNVLETVTLGHCASVHEAKTLLLGLNTAYRVLMSGSGPTVFALFENRKKAELAYKKAKKTNKETYLVRTL